MNKTHGLVATAWMLGSGLLLNANLTVQAQVSAPPAPEEYYAPQRSAPASAKKAPGLLPEAIRNADSSQNGAIARPIAPSNNSLDAGRKINGTNPAPLRPSNRSAVMPATHQQDGLVIQPANQSDAAPSPIQKQLEEMYRKDGRPMPQMNFNQTPIPTNGQVPMATGNNRPNVASSNAVPPKPRSLLDKLNPFSRNKSAPAPMPQHPANPIPNTAARPPQMMPGMTPGLNGIKPAGANQVNGFNNTAARSLPVPPAATPAPQPLPVPAAVQQPAQPGSQLSNTLPPVPGDPGFQGAAAQTSGEPVTVPPAPASIDDALENAFSDMSEDKAEVKADEKPSKPAETKSAENDNPFSGLSLDGEFGPASKPAATESTKPATAKDETTTDDESASETKPVKTPMESTEDMNSDSIPLPPEALPTEPAKEEVEAKMKLIAERGELRGLKGFCPVALRDDRDLKNALPEHHSTFKGRTFYFSTADAKTAFDEHPQHYAPVSGGQDVVLLKEKVTKEGSLDHAVWFKDRLYLFTSQKTLEHFVATPSEFAINE